MHGRNNGKKLMSVRIVKHTFEIIHLLTGENPLKILVDAIKNSGPREDSTRIGRAGTVRRQAVDVSPLRRVNQAIWLLCTGKQLQPFKSILGLIIIVFFFHSLRSSRSFVQKHKDHCWMLGWWAYQRCQRIAQLVCVQKERRIRKSCRLQQIDASHIESEEKKNNKNSNWDFCYFLLNKNSNLKKKKNFFDFFIHFILKI